MGLFSPDYPAEADMRMVVSAHEVGHAVAYRAAGLTVRYARLESGVFGGLGGRAKIVEQLVPEKKVAGYAVACLAGSEAEARYLARHYGVSLAKARCIAAPALEASDLDEFKQAAKHAGLSRSEGQRRAEQVISTHWGMIERLATKLARKNKLTGWDF